MSESNSTTTENSAQAGAWSEADVLMWDAYISELEAHERAEMAELAERGEF